MTPWLASPKLTVDWAAPELSAWPDALRAEVVGLMEATLLEAPAMARFIADLARLRTQGRFHKEARAVARWLGVSWRPVVLTAISYDLALSVFGCSTVLLPTPDGPILARNMDWWPEDRLARASAVVRVEHGGAWRYTHAGWPGALGVVSGLSPRGFGLVLNAVSGPEGVRRSGYPVMLMLRRVLEEASDFGEAVLWLERQTLAAPCLISVVGRTNAERVVIERSPTRAAVRRPRGDAPLVTTNDYRVLFADDDAADGFSLHDTACARFDRLSACFADHGAGDVDDATLLGALTDPEVLQSITCQHVVIRPHANTIDMWTPARFGSPLS